MNTCKTCQGVDLGKTKNVLQNEGGFALLVVLGILLLVTLLALGAFGVSDTDRAIASNNVHNHQAYYAAEAGALRAMAHINDSAHWRAGYANASLGNGSYRVDVWDSSSLPALKDTVKLLSTGWNNGSERQIEVLLAPRKIRRFRYAAFGDTLVYYNGNAQIDAYNSDSGIYLPHGMGGDVGSNELIYFNGSDDIYGDVSTPDTISLNGSVNIYGDTNNTAPPVVLDSITTAEMAYAELTSNASSGLIFTGGASYDPISKRLRASGSTASITMSAGTYYFSHIDLQSGSKLVVAPGAKVTIYLKDSLYANGGTLVNTTLKPENLQIFSTGRSVYLTGNVSIYAAIYAPNAEIKLNGDAQIYGSAIGKSVCINGNGGIHYDRALANLGDSGKGLYKKVAWRVF